jgi:hypothetical protein
MNKSFSWVKNHKIYVLLFLIIIFIYANFITTNKKPIFDYGHATGLSTDSTPRHIKIGSDDFGVPKNYLDSWKDESGFLAIALLPDFSPMTEENHAEFGKTYGDANHRIYILTELEKNSTSLDHVYKNARSATLNYVNFALAAKNPSKVVTNPYVGKGVKYGLFYEEPFITTGRTLTKELYTEKENGKIISFIECTQEKDEAVQTQGCNQYFVYKNYLINMSYRKYYLSEWRDLQKKSIKLIESFKMTSILR